MGRRGDWWSDWAEASGWTAPAAATMPDCSRDFLFQLLSNEVVADKDERGKALSVNVERGAGIFCKIVIVCFLSVRYRSDGLYYKMAGPPSSPTLFFILTLIKSIVGDDRVPAILQYWPPIYI